ncbi:MAG: hypothetical protein WBM13_01515 [Bacteroidia bacterium]
MKKALFYITTITSSLLCSSVFAQSSTPDSLGLPGDNLNLYAVLDLFQKSETLEEFEKSLNAQKSKVNNLDLNKDNQVDYIRVIDNVKGEAHAIVLQVAVSPKENQDVAVITVEKEDDNNVRIQMIGDEMLYGKDYIIEPKQNNAKTKSTNGTPNPGYVNENGQTTNITNNYYNDNSSNYSNPAIDYWYPVASWSIVRWMYYPGYVAYVSPWGWGYNPWYWNAWTPVFWHSYYYGCVSPYWGYYNGWFCRSNMIRNSFARDYYYGSRRSTSTAVNDRRNSGEYKTTYSRPDLASKQVAQANNIRPTYNKTSTTASRNANTSGSKQEFTQKGASAHTNYSNVKSDNNYSMKGSAEAGNTINASKYPSSTSGNSNKYNYDKGTSVKESNSVNGAKYPSSSSSTNRSQNKYSVNSNNSVKEMSKPSGSRFNSSSMGSGSSKPSNFSSGRSYGGGGFSSGGSSSFGGGGGGGRSFGGGGSVGGGGRK